MLCLIFGQYYDDVHDPAEISLAGCESRRPSVLKPSLVRVAQPFSKTDDSLNPDVPDFDPVRFGELAVRGYEEGAL